jgi:hypothetical protein
MIFVDHYFRLHQTPKNAEIIFLKNILYRNKQSIYVLLDVIYDHPHNLKIYDHC